MPESNVNVDQWVEMFRSVGLSEEQMQHWHRQFEQRHPQGHQGFLEWLGLPEKRIADIRRKSAC